MSDVIWFLNYRKGVPGKTWVQENYMKQLNDVLAPVPKAYRYPRKIRSNKDGKTVTTPYVLNDEFGY